MSDFVNTTRAMFEFEWNPVFNWMPVVEKNDYGQERFLVEDPYKTMLSGNIHKVPLITGITQYEFYYLAYCKCISMFNNYYNIFMNVLLFYRHTSQRDSARAIQSRFFKIYSNLFLIRARHTKVTQYKSGSALFLLSK